MSKIDEFIEDYSDYPNNALLAFDRAEYHNKPTDGLMVVTVEDIEQLRPYVEWTELTIARLEEICSLLDETIEERLTPAELEFYQQIKEQSK